MTNGERVDSREIAESVLRKLYLTVVRSLFSGRCAPFGRETLRSPVHPLALGANAPIRTQAPFNHAKRFRPFHPGLWRNLIFPDIIQRNYTRPYYGLFFRHDGIGSQKRVCREVMLCQQCANSINIVEDVSITESYAKRVERLA